MIRVAHLSDLHFGAHLPELVAPLLADMARFAPDAVVVSGDLTQHADPAEFVLAAAFLAGLPAPSLAVPGNHDIPRGALERLADPRRRWRRHIAASTEPTLLLPGVALLGLDTVRRMQPHLDWSAGGISAARLARLEERVRACAERLVLVVAHHPLRHPNWALSRATPLGAGAALTGLAREGVAAMLSGHLHRAALIAGEPQVVITGSTLSHRTSGRPNSWTLVELAGCAVRTTVRVAGPAGWQAADAVPFPA